MGRAEGGRAREHPKDLAGNEGLDAFGLVTVAFWLSLVVLFFSTTLVYLTRKPVALQFARSGRDAMGYG
jgi:hypothetical protein